MTRPQLTRDEARHVLEEIADLVTADHKQGARIWTGRVIRGTVTPLCHWIAAEDPDYCGEIFEEYARERAVSGRAEATYEDIEAAEASADRLLALLIGEPVQAVA